MFIWVDFFIQFFIVFSIWSSPPYITSCSLLGMEPKFLEVVPGHVPDTHPLNGLYQLGQGGGSVVFFELFLHERPAVLDGIQVRKDPSPAQESKPFLLMAIHHQLVGAAGGTVLHESLHLV